MAPNQDIDPTARGFLPASEAILGDCVFVLHPPGLPDPAELREYEELRAGGLLNAAGDQILPTECPAIWRFPPDGLDWFCCERPRGHDGKHMFKMLWEHVDG